MSLISRESQAIEVSAERQIQSSLIFPFFFFNSDSSSKFTWGRPDEVGSEAIYPNGTKYMKGPGVGTSAFLTHERLRSRNFIKEDGVYILLTMEGMWTLMIFFIMQ